MVPLAFVWLFAMFLTCFSEDMRNVTAIHSSDHKEYLHIAKWVKVSEGSVPSNAVYAGSEGAYNVYVCRVYRDGATFPGKLLPEFNTCYIALGGEELFFKEYEVLVLSHGVKVEWRPVSGNVIPPGIIQGGKTADGERLYIGRVLHDYSVCVGKVQLSDRYLYIPLQHKQYTYSNYDVLVATAINFS